jgi:O-antigen/teichoic acid export membrane protein
MTITLVAAAPIIAWFYGDSRLLWIAMAISTTFVFGGLTVQHQALLRRQMQFSRLAFITVLSTASSTIIAILLAWQGFEYWALVWKEVSRAAIYAGATWFLSHWWPGLPARRIGIRKMFETGSHVTGFNILTFASRSLDAVLLGKFWGPGSVGLYKQPAQLLMLPVSMVSYPITYVMTPALSALQGEPHRYRNYYKRVLSFLAFVYMPLIAYIGLLSDSLILIILGQKWLASSLVLKIIACSALVDPIGGTCGVVMITTGRTREYLRLGAAQAVFLSIATCIGINWGIVGVAVAGAIYTFVGLPFLVWYSFKNTPISPAMFYEALALPALATGIMSGCLFLMTSVLDLRPGLSTLGYSAGLAPIVYFGTWLLFPHGKQLLIDYCSHFRVAFREIVSRVWPSPSPTASGFDLSK